VVVVQSELPLAICRDSEALLARGLVDVGKPLQSSMGATSFSKPARRALRATGPCPGACACADEALVGEAVLVHFREESEAPGESDASKVGSGKTPCIMGSCVAGLSPDIAPAGTDGDGVANEDDCRVMVLALGVLPPAAVGECNDAGTSSRSLKPEAVMT